MALGGNLGAVEGTLRWAFHQLNADLGPLLVSSLYRTTPLSDIPQPDYLNAAAAGFTWLSPEEALALGQRLERQAGREAGPRNGPRPLDVDLLLYGDTVRSAADLTLPHPRLAERLFVLEPLADVTPDRRVPPHGRRIRELLAELRAGAGGDQGIEEVGWQGAPPLVRP